MHLFIFIFHISIIYKYVNGTALWNHSSINFRGDGGFERQSFFLEIIIQLWSYIQNLVFFHMLFYWTVLCKIVNYYIEVILFWVKTNLKLNFLNHIKKSPNSFIIGNSNIEILWFWLIVSQQKLLISTCSIWWISKMCKVHIQNNFPFE